MDALQELINKYNPTYKANLDTIDPEDRLAIEILTIRLLKEDSSDLMEDFSFLIFKFLNVYKNSMELNFQDDEKAVTEGLLKSHEDAANIILAMNVLNNVKTK